MDNSEFEMLIKTLTKVHSVMANFKSEFEDLEADMSKLIIFLQKKEQEEAPNLLGEMANVPAEVGKMMTNIIQGTAESLGIELQVKKHVKKAKVKKQ